MFNMRIRGSKSDVHGARAPRTRLCPGTLCDRASRVRSCHLVTLRRGLVGGTAAKEGLDTPPSSWGEGSQAYSFTHLWPAGFSQGFKKTVLEVRS